MNIELSDKEKDILKDFIDVHVEMMEEVCDGDEFIQDTIDLLEKIYSQLK